MPEKQKFTKQICGTLIASFTSLEFSGRRLWGPESVQAPYLIGGTIAHTSERESFSLEPATPRFGVLMVNRITRPRLPAKLLEGREANLGSGMVTMRKILLCIAVMVAAVSAHAGTVDVTLLGFSGGNWQNGYPYYITFGPGGALQTAMCDDYMHGGAPGQSWQANVTVLGSDDLSLARFNMLPDALTLYKEAGWILLQTPFTDPTQWKDMNYAVWHIFDNAVPLDMGAQGWLNAAEAEAQLGFPGVDFNHVFILTPVFQHDPNLNDPQEFLYIDPPGASTTPEPSTFVLLGSGIPLLFRRKLFG